ncbi:hypothetical protein CASFOL_021041 [Castilleja foliolosa]|uniref:RNase H type-1 domain-containing protein n=1 Tax=Castilleja foliolosa TaxID=1961234 RepID=A0ABD3CWD1_9LAMI
MKNKMFSSLLTMMEFLLFNVVLFDNIWLYRNSIAHGSPPLSVQDLVTLITKKANLYWLSMVQTIQSRSSPNHKWIPPPSGWHKINVDSTFDNGSAYSGVIIRDEAGSIILAASGHHTCHDVISAESLAILDACSIISELKMRNVIFESHCLNAISFINGASNNNFWAASPIVDQIRRSWNSWPSWIFKFSSRCSNGAAHEMAKWAKNSVFVGVGPLNAIPISVFCE